MDQQRQQLVASPLAIESGLAAIRCVRAAAWPLGSIHGELKQSHTPTSHRLKSIRQKDTTKRLVVDDDYDEKPKTALSGSQQIPFLSIGLDLQLNLFQLDFARSLALSLSFVCIELRFFFVIRAQKNQLIRSLESSHLHSAKNTQLASERARGGDTNREREGERNCIREFTRYSPAFECDRSLFSLP